MFVTNRAVLSGKKNRRMVHDSPLIFKEEIGSDLTSDLLMHAMARNSSGVIRFAIYAGILGMLFGSLMPAVGVLCS